MNLYFHPESDCYFYATAEELSDSDALTVDIVTGIEHHEAEALRREVLKPPEIESGIPIPAESVAEPEPEPAKRKITRTKRKCKLSQNPAIASILEPLKFISQIQKKTGTPNQQFCAISGGWIVASNGVCMLGSPIELDLSACIHTLQFADALTKCGQELAISQLNDFSISVKSEQFKALISCESFSKIELESPDENVFAMSESDSEAFTNALKQVQGLATDGAANAAFAGVALRDGSAVATNGQALLESWHGVALPTILLPKASCAILAKLGSQISGFGFGGTCCTFWLKNGAFVRSGLFVDKFPPFAHLLETASNFSELPAEFFKAVHSVKNFSKNGIVYFDKSLISSREIGNEATTYKIEGLPVEMAFDSRQLAFVEHAMQNVDFNKTSNRCTFNNGLTRGVLMGVDLSQQKVHNQTFEEQTYF